MEFANKMAALGADHVMVFGGFVGEENVTYTFVIGNGNAFSQVGHVRSWLRKREYDLSYDDGGSDPDSEWAG